VVRGRGGVRSAVWLILHSRHGAGIQSNASAFILPATLLRYARAIGRKINVALVEADPVKA
jgi:hypothetical protein